ncbi:MAG: RDD family protein [Actinomycetia bacterium]|nr:RDD family protein [Actinomycetes bacterium]
MTDLPPPPPSFGGPVFDSPQPTYHLSGWWRRVGAWFLDYLIVSVPLWVAAVAFQSNSSAIAGLYLIWILGVVAYHVLMIGSTGQTVGKMAAGVKVVRDASPAPVGYGLAIGRFFATFLSSLPCYLGYLWPLWDDKNQTFHDKICSTLVVRA